MVFFVEDLEVYLMQEPEFIFMEDPEFFFIDEPKAFSIANLEVFFLEYPSIDAEDLVAFFIQSLDIVFLKRFSIEDLFNFTYSEYHIYIFLYLLLVSGSLSCYR